MGSTGGMLSKYTVEDMETEIANLTPRLPVAALMNGGIIKLQGANGFFNPNSLLDPSWLKDKMTVEQYQEAINYINKSTAYAFVGLSKMYPTSERTIRENMRTQAGIAAVEDINKRFSSVKFTYQPTAQTVPMSMTYSTDPVVQSFTQRNGIQGNSQVVLLYITVQ